MPQEAQEALRALRVQWALRSLKAQWAAGIRRGIEASMGSKGQGALKAESSMGWGSRGIEAIEGSMASRGPRGIEEDLLKS